MRKVIIGTLTLIVVGVTMAITIYRESIETRRTTPEPPALRYWKSEAALPADLSGLFNNDGVASASDPTDTNFDCPHHPPNVPGSGYPEEHLPKSGSVVRPPGVDHPFLFPVLTSGEHNNLTCHGQRIDASAQPAWRNSGEVCSKVLLLGAAENGSASGTLTLEYADGSTSPAKVSFPDWCEAADDPAAVSAPYRYTIGPNGRKGIRQRINCYMFVRAVPADPSKTLVALLLPNRPNMHLFAVTLVLSRPEPDVACRGDMVARKYHNVAMLADAPEVDLDEPIDTLGRALRTAADSVTDKL
ncbi:MAG: hypothetical protein ACOC8E_07940, partial [Planctomycetota bacterium]